MNLNLPTIDGQSKSLLPLAVRTPDGQVVSAHYTLPDWAMRCGYLAQLQKHLLISINEDYFHIQGD